ncbi:MAG: DUF5678 domain-containing protein [Candidatus Curtissbacteria bacterium]|nr:DUF5678 domain-containing protein [Candidatus Curtissbacteria bacterium]
MKKEIKNIRKYSNKWIALDEKRSKVIYASDTYRGLLKILGNTKQKVYLMKLPPFIGTFAP